MTQKDANASCTKVSDLFRFFPIILLAIFLIFSIDLRAFKSKAQLDPVDFERKYQMALSHLFQGQAFQRDGTQQLSPLKGF